MTLSSDNKFGLILVTRDNHQWAADMAEIPLASIEEMYKESVEKDVVCTIQVLKANYDKWLDGEYFAEFQRMRNATLRKDDFVWAE